MKRLKVRGSATSLFSIMKGSNCPLTTAIDSYLLTEKDDEGRKHGFNSPSGIKDCVRSLYYVRKFYDCTNVIKPRTKRVFHNGKDVHTRIQNCLIKSGLLLQEEPPVFNAELQILGNADGLALINGHLGVLEIKSINHCEYVGLIEPKPEHIKQASIYMYCFETIRQAMQSEDFCGEELANKYYLSLDKSLKVKERKSRKQSFLKMLNLIEDYKTTPIDSIDFLYENKNTQEIKEFIVYWDESIMQEIKSKYTFLNECIAKNRIPDRPEGSTKSGSCKNCKYKGVCYSE
jgi:hypothetical protein